VSTVDDKMNQYMQEILRVDSQIDMQESIFKGTQSNWRQYAAFIDSIEAERVKQKADMEQTKYDKWIKEQLTILVHNFEQYFAMADALEKKIPQSIMEIAGKHHILIPKTILRKQHELEQSHSYVVPLTTISVKQPSQALPKLIPQSPSAQVFISYSHKDKKPFLDEFLEHLKPFVRTGISVWSDKQIAPGSQWFPEIKNALASTKVAVLMVSPAFLASDFIHDHELGPVLKLAEQGGVRIIWIPIRACAYQITPLKDYQAVLPPEKPLAEMKAERDRAWVKICESIAHALSSGPSVQVPPIL
jgi:hypothetical protein